MDNLNIYLEKYLKKTKKKKKWFKLLVVFSSLVVFCTTYALILPAITMETKTWCGHEEHDHDQECFESIIICGKEENDGHIHSDECHSLQLMCEKEETEGHTHTEECHTKSLICEKEEQLEHVHNENCYESMQICNEEANQHKHNEDCFENKLSCLNEDENHVHNEECYVRAQICNEAFNHHEHNEECFKNKLICTDEEIEGHVHEDICYQDIVQCEIQEQEAHSHDDSCYKEKCEQEECEAHQHDDTCYEEKFVCEKEEHVHEKMCYSNPNADLENASVWESTLPNELSGEWATDIVEVAKTQLGYKESKKNYIVTKNDVTKGYTRYGEWYGDKYGDWCAMFVSFCLNYANIDKELIPLDLNCQRWIETLSNDKYNLYNSVKNYQPNVGDIVFFDNDLNGISDHVGIVTEIDNKLHTIEGNAGNGVYQKKYSLDDETIIGYATLPENPNNIEETYVKQTVNATIYKDGSFTEINEEDKTLISVTGYLPEGATVRAFAVTIEQNVIDGMSVMVAYDIAIYNANGEYVEIDDTQNPLSVSIIPNDLPKDVEETDIYYIPDEGEPEKLESEKVDQELTFETSHFSTYAIVISGELSQVYVNGTSGSDSNAGTSTRPVKTLDKALALVKDGGTIFVTGSVTINTTFDLDVKGSLTIKRGSSFTGALILLDGGNLTLGNVKINGGSSAPNTDNIATNTTFVGDDKAPLIVIQNNGTLNIKDGATLEYNSNKPDTTTTSNTTTFKENGYVGLGGAIYANGATINMTGGLIQYCEAQAGGGLYLEKTTFNLIDGTIDHNYARNIVPKNSRKAGVYYKNAGGGVYVGDNSVMNMSGGLITNNQTSREGGGVSLGWLNRAKGTAIDEFITTFNMSGGTFKGNLATSTGGGLNITAGRQAFIMAGTFTENTANGVDWQFESGSSAWSVYSGGAIYLDAKQKNSSGQYAGKPGYAVINRVLITGNTATMNGGGAGISTCSTSSSSVNASIEFKNGTLIYGNNSNEMVLGGTINSISSEFLGGGKYNWSKSGSVYNNTLNDNSSGVAEGKKLATVIITNNKAYDGGGIGCNGEIEIGGEEDTESITITKQWKDEDSTFRPNSITVQVYQDGQKYGDSITIYKSKDASGNETWPIYYVDGLPTGHKYTIEEIKVDGYEPTISQDGNNFTIINQLDGFKVIKKWENDLETNRPSYIEVQLYQNGNKYGEVVRLTKDTNWQYIWTNLPEKDSNGKECEYSAKEINIPKGYYSINNGVLENGDWVITNTLIPTTAISVEKQWAQDTPKTESVTVQLLANGNVYKEIVLNDTNNWKYVWESLPTKDENGNDITYRVTEVKIPGYSFEVSNGVPIKNKEKVPTWIESNTLPTNQEFILVANNKLLASKDPNQLQWLDAESYLNDVTLPNDEAVWNYSNSKLKNNSGKYLTLNRTSNWGQYTYTFRTDSTGSTIAYSNNTISSEYSNYYGSSSIYYLTSTINNGYGSTTTSSTSSDIAKFTVYYLGETEIEVDGNGTHYVITNTKDKEVFMDLTKYSTLKDKDGNFTLLAGANLALYKEDQNGTLIPETSVNGTLVKEWVSTNIINEKVNVQLENGTYYLVETNAPEGHQKLQRPIIFTVDIKEQKVKITSYPGFEELEGELIVNDDSIVNLPIYNLVTFLLPDTGGIGTHLFKLGGTLLMMMSVIVYLISSKKKRDVNID